MSVLGAAVLMLAGCAGPAPRSTQMTPLPSPEAQSVAIEATPAQAAIPAAEAVPAPMAEAAPAPAAVEPVLAQPASPAMVAAPAIIAAPTNAVPLVRQTVSGWLDVPGWLEERGLPPMQKLGPAAEPVFEIRIPQGVFTLALGSRNARWNGVFVGLGYAPKMAGGRLQAHALDLEKNLVPLLDPSPAPPGKGRTIVIDPGHGGPNAGALSVHNGRHESELTLDWARRLQGLLETNGWQVVLTRTNDVELDLPARIAVADRVDADLFVSLHFNTAAPDPAPVGLETYCVTPAGLPSNLTRGYADPVWRTLPNNAFDASNLQYAARIHRAMIGETAAVDRGVRRARFMDVLGPQRRTAVLVEGGFLSSPREARLIAGADYRQKLARAMATAIGPAAPVRVTPDLLATPASEPAAETRAAGK